MSLRVSPPGLRRVSTRLVRGAIDALFPEQCVGCGRFGEALCPLCIGALPLVDREAACFRCRALVEGPLCTRCDAWDALASAFPAFYHEGAARAAVHALKYARQRSLAPLMAALVIERAALPPVDAACFVPLHPARWRRRGFNQSRLLARSLGLPAMPGQLRRLRNTRSQVGLNHSQRRANMAGAFVYEGPPLEGRAIALVDDVITTGATANECARVLRESGADAVFAVSFTIWKPAPRAFASQPIDD